MSIATAVKHYLQKKGIAYRIANHTRSGTLEEAAQLLGICQSKIVRAVVLKDHHGMVMAILPVTHCLDTSQLNNIMGRELTLVSGKEADKLFHDCEPGSRPPLGEAYGLECIVDESVAGCDEVYFEPGTHYALLHMRREDFYYLLSSTLSGSFAYPDQSIALISTSKKAKNAHLNDDNLALQAWQPIESIYQLPEQPVILPKLLQCQHSGHFDQDWLDVMNQEKQLLAMILKLASIWDIDDNNKEQLPPHYTHLEQALTAGVAPYWLNALMISLLAIMTLNVPEQGPLGGAKILRHAVYAGYLARYVQSRISADDYPYISDAALFCMLQNIGVLLLGHLFKPEYQLLNRLGAADPTATLTVIEQRVLGMGQAHEIMSLGFRRMGAWLLSYWQFPTQVVDIVAASNLQVPTDSPYPIHIVQMVNTMLYQLGFLPAVVGEAPYQLNNVLAKLNIGYDDRVHIHLQVAKHSIYLDEILQLINRLWLTSRE